MWVSTETDLLFLTEIRLAIKMMMDCLELLHGNCQKFLACALTSLQLSPSVHEICLFPLPFAALERIVRVHGTAKDVQGGWINLDGEPFDDVTSRMVRTSVDTLLDPSL